MTYPQKITPPKSELKKLGKSVWDSVWNSISNSVGYSISNSVSDSISNSVGYSVGNSIFLLVYPVRISVLIGSFDERLAKRFSNTQLK